MSEKLFNVGIKGVIVDGDKVLILKGASGRDFWEVPGGRIDGNESIEQTLIRELQEELPNIKSIQIGNVLDAYRVQKDIKEETSLTLIFIKVKSDFDGDPEISDEHSDWEWAEKSRALELVHDSCKSAIKKAFED